MSTYPQMTLSGIAQTMQINLMREVPQTMMILGQSGVGKTQWFRFELPKLVADAKRRAATWRPPKRRPLIV